MTTNLRRTASAGGRFVRGRAPVALALLLVLGVTPTATAATPTPFDTNLLVNPKAEDGGSTRGYTQVAIPGWTPVNKATVVRYGSTGFPTTAESARIGGGRKFFSCGPNGGGVIYQQVKVRSRAALIDAGRVAVQVKGLVATYDSQSDSGRIQVIPLDQDDLGITQLSTSSQSATNGVFKRVSLTATLPVGTRFVLVRLYGYNVSGDYCDAYFDNVSLKLRQLKA